MGGAADPEGGGGGPTATGNTGTGNRDPEEMFCLKWNDYQENVVATLSELRAEEDFFDVTLAVDGDQVRLSRLTFWTFPQKLDLKHKKLDLPGFLGSGGD